MFKSLKDYLTKSKESSKGMLSVQSSSYKCQLIDDGVPWGVLPSYLIDETAYKEILRTHRATINVLKDSRNNNVSVIRRVYVKDFSPILFERDDGETSGVAFRRKFLKEANSRDWWNKFTRVIELDFEGVEVLGPAWANEVFTYFMMVFKVTESELLSRIKPINISDVKLALIKLDLNIGYRGVNHVE